MFRSARWVAAGVLVAAVAATAPADDSMLKVKVGDQFPDFTLPVTAPAGATDAKKEMSLADLKGKTVVIAFYPKAKTGG
jgi:peroxiredoxin Q/BCP